MNESLTNSKCGGLSATHRLPGEIVRLHEGSSSSTTATSPPLMPRGWLPTGIGGRYLTVRWIQIGDRLLSEPFFRDSVQALRLLKPRAKEFESGIDLLIESASALQTVRPAGVIFHVSRCGSTLVLNALKTSVHAVGLAEVSAMDAAMQLARSQLGYWARIGSQLSISLVSLFAHYLPDASRRVIVKCGFDGILSIKALRSIWPGVPFVILVRDPLEVVVSNLENPPRWLVDGMRDPRWGTPPAVCSRGLAHVASWMLGRACTAALAALDDDCLVVDYADLDPKGVLRIGKLFGLEFADSDYDRFSGQFRIHAKNREQFFEPDSCRKQVSATDDVRNSVAECVAPAYQRLLQARCSSAVHLPADI